MSKRSAAGKRPSPYSNWRSSRSTWARPRRVRAASLGDPCPRDHGVLPVLVHRVSRSQEREAVLAALLRRLRPLDRAQTRFQLGAHAGLEGEVVRGEEQLFAVCVAQLRRERGPRVHFLDRLFPARDEKAAEHFFAELLNGHCALPAQLRARPAQYLGCLEGWEQARVDAAEHGNAFVVDHAAQHRVARYEHCRTANLMDAALFAREQIAHGHGLAPFDREHFPDAQPGVLLREKPRALVGAEAGAALLEEPLDDRAAFDLEDVDGPWTEELH